MLVLVGPPFQATNAEIAQLAQLTGLVAYDLRSKLKPNAWGVVRALADAASALQLADTLVRAGFRTAAVDPAVGHDPQRKFVSVRGIGLRDGQLELQLRERVMPVPLGAVLCGVRGEVRPQSGAPRSMRSRQSSSTFRAVVPSATDVAVFRESLTSGEFDGYQALDLHFITVPWVARLDARHFDFSVLKNATGAPARDLDLVAEQVAHSAGNVRIDRDVRRSSLMAFTARPASMRRTPSPGSGADRGAAVLDPEFDPYSRMIAEAERSTRRLARELQGSTGA